MPFSHFRGNGRGGFTPPVASTGTGGFTLNRFTVNGFTPLVDGLRHGRSRKSFTICSYEKCARNSPGMCSCKSLDLKVFGINTYKKQGVGGTPSLPPYSFFSAFRLTLWFGGNDSSSAVAADPPTRPEAAGYNPSVVPLKEYRRKRRLKESPEPRRVQGEPAGTGRGNWRGEPASTAATKMAAWHAQRSSRVP